VQYARRSESYPKSLYPRDKRSKGTDMSEAIIERELSDSSDNGASIKTASDRELTEKERTFCRNLISGMNQRTAYLSAGYNASSTESADAAASQVKARPRVSEYLRQLREAAFTANVLTLAEKRDYLARAVRTPISAISADSDLAQGIKYDREGNAELRIPDKLKALELDAKLAGELKEQAQVSQTFNFAMLGDRAEGDVIELPSSGDTSQE
jgi:hypothetical protein